MKYRPLRVTIVDDEGSERYDMTVPAFQEGNRVDFPETKTAPWPFVEGALLTRAFIYDAASDGQLLAVIDLDDDTAEAES